MAKKTIKNAPIDILEKLNRGENTGVRIEIRDTDFHAGTATAVPFTVRNSSGDWEQYKPTDEWQTWFKNNQVGYDTESCTNFGCVQSIDMQFTMLIRAGAFTDAQVAEMRALNYFDDQGNIHFSPWFNALTSGTTEADGNTLQAPWDAVRKYGLIGEADGYTPNDFTTASQWFNKKNLTQTHLDKAKKFLQFVAIAYQWVDTNQSNDQKILAYYLQQSPLTVATPTCNSWNNPEGTVVTNCDPYRGLNHCTDVIAINPDNTYKDLDHYHPFIKKLSADYYVPCALMGVVTVVPESTTPTTPTTTPTTTTFKHTFTKQMDQGARNSEVLALQQALISLGYAIPDGPTNYFGKETLTALQKFQCDKMGICKGTPKSNGYGRVGAKTIAALNNLVS